MKIDEARPQSPGRSSACSPREPRSGYDLKRSIDRTIRHFWAASYGQIYPELKRLEEAGWIVGADGGSRARRVYRATPAGRAALVDWLHGEETRIELRDESLLRLFFADTLPADEALGLLRARRDGLCPDARIAPLARRRKWRARPAVRRPRLSLGPRLLRMGDRVVRTAGTPLAQTQLDDLPPPTWRSLVARGMPQFAAEALLPVAAFYAGWRLSGLAAGIGVSAIISIALAAVLIRRGREVGLVVVGAAFVVIQAVVGLVSGSATVYLAQPVVLSGLWGIAYVVSVLVGRPLIGVFACAWYPFPAWFRASAPFKREFGMQSLVWAAYCFARAAVSARAAAPRGGRCVRARLLRHRHTGDRGVALAGACGTRGAPSRASRPAPLQRLSLPRCGLSR